MYKISHAKCVCFLFLVIISVLSCSGFRIDSIAMTDISKRNSHTSVSLASNPADFIADRRINPFFSYGHRIRHHHRQSRSNKKIKPHDSHKKQHQKHQQQQQQRFALQREAAWKALKSNTIVIAETHMRYEENCSFVFRVTKIIKDNKLFVNKDQLKFVFERRGNNCQVLDYPEFPDRFTNFTIDFKQYILFFNSMEGRVYSLVGTPMLVRNGKFDRILPKPRDMSSEPVIKTLNEIKTNSTKILAKKRRKLVCTASGYPAPYISWKLNNSELDNNNNSVRIVNRNKKKNVVKSILVIKNDAFLGTYKCIARGMNKEVEKKIDNTSLGELCVGIMKTFCSNGGTCYMMKNIGEARCECADGFSGTRCDNKDSLHISSTYDEDNNYLCKSGFSTKYYC